MNKYSYWQHIFLFLPQLIRGRPSPQCSMHCHLCTGCIFGYIAMEIITYATVMNANRPGLWPCHERYADKQVTPKARHNSDGEEP